MTSVIAVSGTVASVVATFVIRFGGLVPAPVLSVPACASAAGWRVSLMCTL
ncbi:hypothetical protein [Nonomuraea sp. NPDC003709]|uniref:hypothetical protein n=1 Tax=Nonomuraea sp. NPDC003709 TaxID=3154450 RepID=UPI0033BCBB5F